MKICKKVLLPAALVVFLLCIICTRGGRLLGPDLGYYEVERVEEGLKAHLRRLRTSLSQWARNFSAPITACDPERHKALSHNNSARGLGQRLSQKEKAKAWQTIAKVGLGSEEGRRIKTLLDRVDEYETFIDITLTEEGRLGYDLTRSYTPSPPADLNEEVKQLLIRIMSGSPPTTR